MIFAAKLSRMRLVAGLILLAAPCLPSQAAVRPRGEQAKNYTAWVKSGEALRDAGKDAEAEAAFQKALAFPSDDFHAEAALARINSERGRWQKAADFFERARRKAPANYLLCTQLARTYANMGRLDLAKKTYAEAKRIDPKQSDAYIMEGYARLYAGEYAQAEDEFQTAIAVDTTSPYGYHHMASYYQESGDLAEAERYLKKTLELLDAQRTPETARRLGYVMHTTRNLANNILMRQGRLDEAETLLRRALPRSIPLLPWHVQILDTLARVYARQHKRAQAEECFQQAVALCRPETACADFTLRISAAPLIHLALLYADEGRKSQALEAADEAWRRYPPADRTQESDILDAVEAGELYSRLGEDSKAERAYRLVASQRERLPPTLTLGNAEARLAYLCLKTGKYGEAFKLSRASVRIVYLHGNSRQGIRRELGLAWTWLRLRLKWNRG